VLDGGACDIGIESTVLMVEPDGKLMLLRPGRISGGEIEAVAGKLGQAGVGVAASGVALPSPGLTASHYAPQKPLVFLAARLMDQPEPERKELKAELPEHGNAGVIVFDQHAASAWHDLRVAGMTVQTLSSAGDIEEAARRLFSTLRQLDNDASIQTLWAEPIGDGRGLSFAVNDRLRRASRSA
jgi:L-threonylcarbamoyladenylate synthase